MAIITFVCYNNLYKKIKEKKYQNFINLLYINKNFGVNLINYETKGFYRVLNSH